jgi:biopolymer transport protein ExbB
MTGTWEQLFFYLQRGGFVMVPLVAAALLLWYGLGYRLLTLRRGSHRSVRLIIERTEQGVQAPPQGVIDSAVVLGLRLIHGGTHRLRRRLDEAFLEFEEAVGRFGTMTRMIVVIAPLLGLLGTVVGMVETFDSLADMSLFAQSGGVAGGLSQALFSTQLGLAVAVPGMIVGRVLNRKQELLEMELCKIKDILCAKAREATS